MQLLVNIDVEQLDRAISFYTSAFDLRCSRRLFSGTVAELVGAMSTIYLLEKPSGTLPSSSTKSVRDYRRHWTPIHLDFVVTDLSSAVERAENAGAQREGDIQSFEWGKQATLADPFGHGFCLIEFRGKGYDVAM